MENSQIELGKYKHFKGGEYEVVALAKHSETLEDMVVYSHIPNDGGVWVRPLKMFLEEVEVNGQKMPRFKKINN